MIQRIFRPLLTAVGFSAVLGACAPLIVGTGAAVGGAATQERGVKGSLDDQGVSLDINERWFSDDHAAYSGVNLQVQEGRALLSGQVVDPETRVKAVRLAWQANGVLEVINEIEIRDRSSLSDSAQDTWITTKLLARLIGDEEVASRNYSIETVNGTVFLIGVAQNQEELQRVVAHARDVSYVKRVVDYVRIKTAEDAAS
jgi:osmotically-inducible protein OsmY